MKLFSRLIKAVAGDIIRASVTEQMGLTIMGKDIETPDVSHAALVKKYWGWMYSSANIQANGLASLPLRLYAKRGTGQSKVKLYPTREVERDTLKHMRDFASPVTRKAVAQSEDVEEILDHPALTLLQNVNIGDNEYETRELTSVCLDLTGNGYWYMDLDQMGQPISIYVLRPQWTKIVPNKTGTRGEPLKGYLYGRRQDKMVALEPNEVIHFKYPNPHDAYYGMGPVQGAAYAVQRQQSMDQYEAATFKNMGRPDFAVSYNDGELTHAQRVEHEQEWNNAYRGVGNAGKVKIIDARFDIKELGFSPREMAYMQGRPWTLKEIAGAMSVPVGLLDTSDISKAPKAALEGSAYFLAKYGTLPRARRMEQKLNEQLAPLYDDRLFFAFDNPVQSDKDFELQEDTELLKAGAVTVNEVRTKRNLIEVPWGKVPILPTTVAPLGSTSDTQPDDGDSPQTARGKRDTSGVFPGGASFGVIDGGGIHPDLKGLEIAYSAN